MVALAFTSSSSPVIDRIEETLFRGAGYRVEPVFLRKSFFFQTLHLALLYNAVVFHFISIIVTQPLFPSDGINRWSRFKKKKKPSAFSSLKNIFIYIFWILRIREETIGYYHSYRKSHCSVWPLYKMRKYLHFAIWERRKAPTHWYFYNYFYNDYKKFHKYLNSDSVPLALSKSVDLKL